MIYVKQIKLHFQDLGLANWKSLDGVAEFIHRKAKHFNSQDGQLCFPSNLFGDEAFFKVKEKRLKTEGLNAVRDLQNIMILAL